MSETVRVDWITFDKIEKRHSDTYKLVLDIDVVSDIGTII